MTFHPYNAAEWEILQTAQRRAVECVNPADRAAAVATIGLIQRAVSERGQRWQAIRATFIPLRIELDNSPPVRSN